VPNIQLTQREHEVLRLVKRGLTNDEIAARLDISRRTVESHLRTLYHKTGVARRGQLMVLSNVGDEHGYERGRERRDERGHEHQRGRDGAELRGRTGAGPDSDGRVRFYDAALRALTDRQFPLFEERVELTVTIGDRDEQDTVVERRWTAPKPYVVYRILRPIVPWTEGPPVGPDELAVACDMHGQDIQVEVLAVQDVDGRPVVIALFQPGLQAETEWVLRYRSPGLWAPLRESGEDTLTWATATFDKRHQPTINALTLKVIFPSSWTGERVAEQNDLGDVEAERLPTGQRQLTWRHRSPVAPAYNWVLRGRKEA
jgi:DNA-binding CsgD family transcriptional regulator